MEVLNLLKFWKISPSHGEENCINSSSSSSTTTSHNDLSIDGSDIEVDEEDDSFFELEITAPDYCNEKNRGAQEENNIKKPETGENFGDCEGQLKTCFSESNLSRFKCRRILPIEPTLKPQSPISILKSAPKFRIFMLGSKTRKTEKTESNGDSVETPKHSQQESKKLTLKNNFEEEVSPSLSFFTRVNSSRTTGSKLQKQSTYESASPIDSSKRFSKEAVQKYLKLIKPFYVKVSKRYSEKVKLSDLMYSASPASSPTPAPVASPKNVPSGFRVLSKHLGKSRSASAAVGMVSPAASRRDDSLLQQDDGIQSAILHCKRSFNSSRGESCRLSRCTSDTSSHEKLTEPWRKSIGEAASDGC